LSLFFAEVKLTAIGADEIRAYQRMRMARAGPVTINHECSILQQLLKRIGRWEEIKADYSPMRLSKESIGRAITDREEDYAFRKWSQKPPPRPFRCLRASDMERPVNSGGSCLSLSRFSHG